MSININIVAILIICVIYFVLKLIKIKKSDDIFLILAFICLFIILAIRKEESDLTEYLRFFNIIGNLNFVEVIGYGRFEIFYLIYNKVIALIFFNDRFFIVITSIITLIGPYLFIKKHSKNYLLSIILFIALGLFHYSFYILRQAIAITFIVLSIDYIKQKNIFKFILFVVIASLFHISSLVFLIAYPVCNIKNMKVKVIIFLVSTILLLLLKGPILDFITSFVYTAYKGYFVSSGYNRLLLFSLMLIFVFIVQMYNKKVNINVDKVNGDSDYEMWISMIFIAIILQVLSTEISVISRLANLFVFAFIIVIPNCIQEVEIKRYRNLLNIMVATSSMIYIFLFLSEKLYHIA